MNSHPPSLTPTPPASTEFTTHPVSLIPPSAVTSALDADFAASLGGAGSVALYLLNPKWPGRDYAYAYDNE